MTTPIRVLVVDDQAIVRKGICALLATEPGIQVVGEAETGQEAVAASQQLRPDVVLMDLVMPGVDGLEATRHITASNPEVRILVLTSFDGDDKLFPALRAGAQGYLLKDSGPRDLVQAIHDVHDGRSSLHPSVACRVLQELAGPSSRRSERGSLTDRELEVLRLVAQGHSNLDIADQLTISEATVRTHVSNILAKLDLGSRTQAALYALRQGLAPLHDTAPS